MILLKGNRLIKNRKHERDIIISPNRGKTAKLIWKHNGDFLCGVSCESARGLAYDLLKWARETEKKYKTSILSKEDI